MCLISIRLLLVSLDKGLARLEYNSLNPIDITRGKSLPESLPRLYFGIAFQGESRLLLRAYFVNAMLL